MFFLYLAVCTLAFGISGTLLTRRRKRYETRIKKFLPSESHTEPVQEASTVHKTTLKDSFRKLISISGKQFQGKTFLKKWQAQLDESATPLKAEEFFVIRLLVGGSLIVIALLLGYTSPLVLIALGAIGYFVPLIVLNQRKNKRMARCAEQLPSSLGTMATAMKAGFSFLQAMQLVGKEIPDPIGPEFNRTLREINLGVPFEEAFHNLLERLPNDDLEIIVNALLVQRTTGGNLAQILESIQETIQERIRIKEDLKTLTAQGRMSAWVISLLPFILGLLLNMMNQEYFSPMLHHPLGWLLIGFGLVSGTIGWFVIQRIVKIEV